MRSISTSRRKPNVRADAMAMSDAETYSAGDLTVTASVSVVFEASP